MNKVLEYQTPVSRKRVPPVVRFSLLLGLMSLAIVAAYVFFKTSFGEKLRDHKLVAAWVGSHRVIAPLMLAGVYFLFAVLMLPVWWLQVLAGYCFGLVMGALWCEVGAVAGAVMSLLLSRWLVGEWFHRRYESRMSKLHAFNEKLGHNGLLVVMGVRLCHMLPFGVSNYLFGLTRITIAEVGLGTLGGGLPAIAFCVAIGAGHHPRDWRVWTVLGAINLVMLIPLIMRYLKPDWFKKIGVE